MTTATATNDHNDKGTNTTAKLKWLFTGSRLLLGLVYFVFGLNGFIQFIPIPPPTEQAGAFLRALAGTGYMFPMVKALEVIGGAMLLSNKYVPLALLILAPITVNILALHLFLDPAGLLMPLVITALGIITAASRWDAFRLVLRA